MTERKIPRPEHCRAKAVMMLPAAVVEDLARVAGLPEVEALDFRRQNGQAATEPELRDWRRIEHFALLVVAVHQTAGVDPRPSCNSCGDRLAGAVSEIANSTTTTKGNP